MGHGRCPSVCRRAAAPGPACRAPRPARGAWRAAACGAPPLPAVRALPRPSAAPACVAGGPSRACPGPRSRAAHAHARALCPRRPAPAARLRRDDYAHASSWCVRGATEGRPTRAPRGLAPLPRPGSKRGPRSTARHAPRDETVPPPWAPPAAQKRPTPPLTPARAPCARAHSAARGPRRAPGAGAVRLHCHRAAGVHRHDAWRCACARASHAPIHARHACAGRSPAADTPPAAALRALFPPPAETSQARCAPRWLTASSPAPTPSAPMASASWTAATARRPTARRGLRRWTTP
jgi:hypothetical protein